MLRTSTTVGRILVFIGQLQATSDTLRTGSNIPPKTPMHIFCHEIYHKTLEPTLATSYTSWLTVLCFKNWSRDRYMSPRCRRRRMPQCKMVVYAGFIDFSSVGFAPLARMNKTGRDRYYSKGRRITPVCSFIGTKKLWRLSTFLLASADVYWLEGILLQSTSLPMQPTLSLHPQSLF